jgi:hypothetical protein
MQCDYRRGFGLVTGFMKHLRIVPTRNSSVIFNSNTQQFVTARTIRYYAASRKVAGSSPDEVDFFKLT